MSISSKSRNSSSSLNTFSNDDPLTFQVIPDVGLKNELVEFVLGMPLNQVIMMIQKNSRYLQNIHLRYSKKSPFAKDVSIYLSSDGIRLYFDGFTQLCKLIEIDNFTRIVLKYGRSVFSDPSSDGSVEKVQDCFGSTHPGAYNEKQKMYVQSWPGVSFCFPTDAGGNIEVTPGFGPNLRSLKYDPSAQPKLIKVSIYRGSNMSEPQHVDEPVASYCGQNRTRFVEAIWENDRLIGLQVTFDTQSGAMIDGDFEVFTMTKDLYFGDSVSTVQSALGAPSKVFYKSDDKMRIHRGATKETLVGEPHFFFNYFDMGIDVLFDFVSKRVIKFVLHTNSPGHIDFSTYSRCNFSISVTQEQIYEIRTASKFEEFSAAFCDPNSDKAVRPVVLQRNEPFGSTFCYGVHQIVVEIMENGHVATLTLYDDKL